MKARRGYTLAELMLVVAILGILAGVGGTLFIQVFRFFRQNQARIDIQRDARAVFDLMSRNLRQAQASTIVIDNAAGQPPYSRVVFTKQNGRELSYYQQGNKLYQVDGGAKAVCENLRYVAFSTPRTDDENLVSIALTLEKGTYEQQTKALHLSVEKINVPND